MSFSFRVIKNSSFINVGYVLNENDSTKHDEGEGKTGFNSRGGVNFTGGGLFQTKVLGTMDGRVTGAGQESLFLTERFTGPMNSGKFLGAVVYYAKREAQYLRSERFANGARETKKDDITINASDCNPGYGLPSYTYTTSVNYYNGGSTLIFEDKWPIKGDFDLNDVVVLYKYIITKNSENKAIKIDATYSLIASGGSNRSGFGIEFPVSSDKAVLSAKNKSSIIYEANQEKAVVVLFNDARNLQRTWNTLPNEAHSDSVTFSFTLTFKEPVTLLNDAFNPFIFEKGTSGEKRSEVHLPYKNGTSLANPVLREGDNSATDWYVTKDRLPWALNIPLASFRYPLERTSISLAYPDITSWAQTGGKEEEMWYNRPVLDKCYIVK